jgi:hypothetical protein
MARAKRKGRAPGYYCVNTKAATRGKRCLHKAVSGKVRFVHSKNIQCPKPCRKYAAKRHP